MLIEPKVTTFVLAVFPWFFTPVACRDFWSSLFFFHISTEKLAEANERADALSRKLEQSEAARKKADLAASKAKAEADEAKAKAAGVEELQKKLKDATAALDEHKAAQASREEGILKRLKTQSRRTFGNFTAPFYF
jgi:uncharacterized protein YlxW (UPF0749 family)